MAFLTAISVAVRQLPPALLFLAALFVGFAVAMPHYLSTVNLQQLMRDFAEHGMLAVAMAIVVLAGAIDLSLGATFALANFAALFLFHIEGVPLGVAAGLVIAAGLLIGAVNGALVAYLKAPAFLTTLAMLLILRALYDLLVTAYTAELAAAAQDTPAWAFLGAGTLAGMPANMAALAAIAFAAHVFLTRTRWGLHIIATGGNEKAARDNGINVPRSRFTAYMLSSGIAATAGFFYAAKQNSAGSDAGLGWEIAALASVVVGGVSLNGGRGTVGRALTGAAILFLLVSGLLRMNVSGSFTTAVTGVVLLVATTMDQWWSQRQTVRRRLKRVATKDCGEAALPFASAVVHRVTDHQVVRLAGVGKTYGGVAALADIDLALHPGEIHALVGENGAGKSTLAGIVAGSVQPTSGVIMIDGQELVFASPADSVHAGIAMVQQEATLVPSMTVAQNLQLGIEPGFCRKRASYQAAKQALRTVTANIDPVVTVETLSPGERQLIGIARGIARQARVLVLDEPTASFSPTERRQLFDLISALREAGVAIVFIAHALEEALQLADNITVLRDGRLVASASASEFTRDSLIRLMTGRFLTHLARQPLPAKRGGRVLSVRNVCMGARVRDVSFDLHAGEIVGFAGLLGAGRTEIARVIAGDLKRDMIHGGTICLRGKAVRYRSPGQAVRDGIVYITEDRKTDGIFEWASAGENIRVGALASRTGKRFFYSGPIDDAAVEQLIGNLRITALTRDLPVTCYSGGNQQKVVMAKALVQAPEIVFFDEPTRGVDVGAIEHIHDTIRELARSGTAVVVISSYLPEILHIAQRILVFRNGTIVSEMETANATEQQILAAAAR